jgi:hypothetical protein
MCSNVTHPCAGSSFSASGEPYHESCLEAKNGGKKMSRPFACFGYFAVQEKSSGGDFEAFARFWLSIKPQMCFNPAMSDEPAPATQTTIGFLG